MHCVLSVRGVHCFQAMFEYARATTQFCLSLCETVCYYDSTAPAIGMGNRRKILQSCCRIVTYLAHALIGNSLKSHAPENLEYVEDGLSNCFGILSRIGGMTTDLRLSAFRAAMSAGADPEQVRSGSVGALLCCWNLHAARTVSECLSR